MDTSPVPFLARWIRLVGELTPKPNLPDFIRTNALLLAPVLVPLPIVRSLSLLLNVVALNGVTDVAKDPRMASEYEAATFPWPAVKLALPELVLVFPRAILEEPVLEFEVPMDMLDKPEEVLRKPIATLDWPLAVLSEPEAKLRIPLAVLFKPKAADWDPIFASSHCVEVTCPARNADFFGFQTMRTPTPDGALAPLKPLPVDTIPSVPEIVNGPASALMVLPAPEPPASYASSRVPPVAMGTQAPPLKNSKRAEVVL
jgi:hypothetical protein